MSESKQSANLGIYRAEEVVAYYARSSDLSACELLLFDTYLKPGMAILDLGVGGGRTTPYLSEIASHYVGLDYSAEMIEVCRAKFPDLQFVVADASDLSSFLDGSFDAVVFSFNGLGHLSPDEKRLQCLRECRRVLKPGGIFIFSSHNPRALFIDWQWDRERLRKLAKRFTGGARPLFYPALALLTCGRIGLALLRTLTKAIPRAYRRLPTKTFWHGEGYLLVPTHGGLLMHFAVPQRVIAEVENFDFKFLHEVPEGYPGKSRRFGTRWFYYAFAKAGAPERPQRGF
jgi:ubiquinone/menaquinone biosynthesis C-methylase UbiE